MKLNESVTWSSQAQGCSKTKTGVIVQIVPAGELPDRDKFRKLYTGAGVGCARNHESYVIMVAGKTPKQAVTYYWPRTSALKVP